MPNPSPTRRWRAGERPLHAAGGHSDRVPLLRAGDARAMGAIDRVPECVRQKHEPLFFVFVLKYFMSIFVGITTGFWIWTSKTADSWWRFIERIVLCRRRAAKRRWARARSATTRKLPMLRYNQVGGGYAQQIAYTEFRSPPPSVQVPMPAQHHPLTAPQPLQQQTMPLLYYKPSVGPLSSSAQSHLQHTVHSLASHGNVNGGTLGPAERSERRVAGLDERAIWKGCKS